MIWYVWYDGMTGPVYKMDNCARGQHSAGPIIITALLCKVIAEGCVSKVAYIVHHWRHHQPVLIFSPQPACILVRDFFVLKT